MSVADFDEEMRSKWHMPQHYREFDIAKWLLTQCKHEEEIQRVGKELLLYQKRGAFPISNSWTMSIFLSVRVLFKFCLGFFI